MSASGGNIKAVEYIECCSVLALGYCGGCEKQKKEGTMCNILGLQCKCQEMS